jgi:hypothetical protein
LLQAGEAVKDALLPNGQNLPLKDRKQRRREGKSPSESLPTVGLEPAADIDLGVGFAAVMARTALVGGFLVPLEYRQLCIAAVYDDPSSRVLTLLTADFTSITRLYHSNPQLLCSLVQVLRSFFDSLHHFCFIPAFADQAAARAGIA